MVKCQSMHSITNFDLTEPALGAMFVQGGLIEDYERGASASKIDHTPVPGMVIHWATQLDAGTLTGTLWRERALAEHFIANVLADAFTEIAGQGPPREQPRPDYSYSTMSLVDYVAGADASRVAGRKIGGAAGAVLVRPRDGSNASVLGPGAEAPAGMIAHVAASDGEQDPWIDIWLDRAAPTAFYEEAGLTADALELVPLHTVFVNTEELDRLPRYPLGPNHLHF